VPQTVSRLSFESPASLLFYLCVVYSTVFKFKVTMKILQQNRLYFPAFTIIAVVLLLLLLIGVSTYRNLDHQKDTALKFTHRQGLTILRVLEAGARTGMLMPIWEVDSIGSLLQETGKGEDISYIYLIDTQGRVVHHSTPSLEGMVSEWHPRITEENEVQTRIRKPPGGGLVYDLAKRFSPLPPLPIASEPKHHQHSGNIIVLGLKMAAFEEARQADIHHAGIMAAIVIALGSGAIFFIFIIQNYYLVDRTLKQTQDYTRQVVASMANGLMSINLKGEIVSYNDLALELLDLNESGLRGMNLNSIIDFKAVGIQETLAHCASILEHKVDYQRKSSGKIPLALSVTPILDDEGACSGAVIVLRDLSEIKQLEEKVRRAEKLAAIGKLSAGVAHEIRNPLSSIKGFAQYLRHTLADHTKEREYADIMVKEVDRINSVVNDLLTFARPLEPDLAQTDVGQLIQHTVRLVQSDADSRDVAIQTQISPELKEVYLDSNQITQALLNLLLNALQQITEGGQIAVGAELDKSGNRLTIWIEDNGPGISVDDKDKIFDPFFTTREKGTGLGLAIVHKIVENHGGEIQMESPLTGETQGCRFTLLIPVNPHRGAAAEH
ncbi:nitrogen regulation protein NR(II), partial [Thermodesulfobacteriota bacterium]